MKPSFQCGPRDRIPEGEWTLYFEEVQWLANYEDRFIDELKYAWDNIFKHKQGLVLILCGSSPSFIINNVLHSKALHNRSTFEIPLREFSLKETKQILQPRPDREVMDAHLTVGGIPEYLYWLQQDSSVFLSLCKNTFIPGSFFSEEYERIFVSSLADKAHYREIVEFLAKRRFATRDEILKHIGISSSGAVSDLLRDLTLCGFIDGYRPYHLGEQSTLKRYCITDSYLQFYYKFVHDKKRQIQNGDFEDDPVSAIKIDAYYQWLGYSFERFCRRHHRLIAKFLGFSGIRYRSGAYFSRASSAQEPG